MANLDNGGQGQADERKRDYAIIVGVTRYPKLSRDGRAVDLFGSINDAEKVREWIQSDDYGGVPEDHVEYVVRAAATADARADPTRDAVVEAFTNMYARCWPNGPEGAPVQPPLGRRLYVYVSGHGLAADLDHGALLCSNSSSNLYSTVAPFASIKAFRQAGFFEQFVVWFDGCMDWAGLEPEPINYVPRPVNSSLPPGPVFTAYAARPRLKTVESPDENGVVRGVFTRTLLAGLKGEGADPETGVIDAYSLKRYLYNAMPKHFPASAKDNLLIDKQPLVKPERGIIFGTNKEMAKWPVILRFGAAAQQGQARIWGRKSDQQSLSLLDTLDIQNGEVRLALANGIYAADVPQLNLRTGFEVTGGAVTKLLS